MLFFSEIEDRVEYCVGKIFMCRLFFEKGLKCIENDGSDSALMNIVRYFSTDSLSGLTGKGAVVLTILTQEQRH
jgi:hypothetical protein